MRRSDNSGGYKAMKRTSQIIYGERQHLLAVLQSLEQFKRDGAQAKQEKAHLEAMVAERTAELNRFHAKWDEHVQRARDRKLSADQLAEMAREASADDYLLLRNIAENPNTPASVLALLARHSYDAVKENVARHRNADAKTLEMLAEDASRPLWLLVACNASAPEGLRHSLRRRMEQMDEAGK
jgi:tryptophan 2,3-dioxygenase